MQRRRRGQHRPHSLGKGDCAQVGFSPGLVGDSYLPAIHYPSGTPLVGEQWERGREAGTIRGSNTGRVGSEEEKQVSVWLAISLAISLFVSHSLIHARSLSLAHAPSCATAALANSRLGASSTSSDWVLLSPPAKRSRRRRRLLLLLPRATPRPPPPPSRSTRKPLALRYDLAASAQYLYPRQQLLLVSMVSASVSRLNTRPSSQLRHRHHRHHQHHHRLRPPTPPPPRALQQPLPLHSLSRHPTPNPRVTFLFHIQPRRSRASRGPRA